MKRKIITITDSGNVTVPSETKMTIPEIADLFGINYREAKRHIRAIKKQRSTERSVVKSVVAEGDYSLPCMVEGKSIYPVYYGIDMIVALAFRVQSKKAEIFRRWICKRATYSSTHTVFTLSVHSNVLN